MALNHVRPPADIALWRPRPVNNPVHNSCKTCASAALPLLTKVLHATITCCLCGSRWFDNALPAIPVCHGPSRAEVPRSRGTPPRTLYQLLSDQPLAALLHHRG